jgi:hypothetical protein
MPASLRGESGSPPESKGVDCGCRENSKYVKVTLWRRGDDDKNVGVV